jgi:hypothetical protein
VESGGGAGGRPIAGALTKRLVAATDAITAELDRASTAQS